MSAQNPGEESRFREQRRSALEGSRSVRGLDFIEAQSHPEGEPAWKLRLYFLPSRPQGLHTGNFRVVDPAGEVDPDVQVTRIGPVQEVPGALDVFLRVSDPERAKRLRVDSAQYRLEIDAPGLDRFFRAAPFRFDGRPVGDAAAAGAESDLPVERDVDYLAKDYDSFRRVLLERMAAHVPEWTERNPADLGVAIVEVLAYAADYLSYYQDAVATEAYLDTARRRSSVRKHLRLLGYALHEGCNSRVWVQIQLNGRTSVDLPAGTGLLTQAGELPPVLIEESVDHLAALEQGSLTFETMHPARLWPQLNRMPVHSWGVADYTLPAGSKSAALAGHFPELQAGDVLIFERLAAPGEDQPDPRLRHAARLRTQPSLGTDPIGTVPITEVEFCEGDELPFSLPVSSSEGRSSQRELVVARANVVLADHGRLMQEELAVVPEVGAFRPVLISTEITRSQPFDPEAARSRAAAAILQRPERSLPAVTLFEVVGDRAEVVGEPWQARLDLLESQPFSAHFVAETESDGRVRLRFGDGRQGRRPTAGTRFQAVYRIGNGPSGHIGHDAVAHIVSPRDLPVVSVGNPLPAQGAEAAEPLETARLVAPRAFRKTQNCVTPADLARLAETNPEVLHAVAEPRWTGSWQTLFLYIQRVGGKEVTPAFESRLREFLEPRLLAGADLEIRSPNPVPLEIRLRAVVEAQAVVEAVRAELLDCLGNTDLEDGRRGFFHPENFTFGQVVHLDSVLDAAMQIDGVLSVDAEVFRAWGSAGEAGVSEGERVLPSVEPGPFEVVSLENRAAEPWLGELTVELEAGS